MAVRGSTGTGVVRAVAPPGPLDAPFPRGRRPEPPGKILTRLGCFAKLMADRNAGRGIDVIGIGAINYDYIAPVSRNLEEETVPESGDEDLSRFRSEDLKDPILRHYYDGGFVDRQMGGSAYLTVKTISHLDDFDLDTAYVGVAATPGDLEEETEFFSDLRAVDSSEEIMREFDHLDDDEWLFESDGTPGRALVELRRGRRQKARVGPGSNRDLVERIEEREERIGGTGDAKPFTRYLASARWIHLTSFSDFDQFRFVVDRIRSAKRLNPHLRVSVDPGYEYTYRHMGQDSGHSAEDSGGTGRSLEGTFEVTDFVFMNLEELTNLSNSDDFEINRDASVLENLSGVEDLQAVVVKEENRHLLINFVNGEPYYREAGGPWVSEYWHRKVWSLNVQNDTGAGDALAGGVIAGLLSPTTLSYKPVPVEIGSSLARATLQSHEFPVGDMNDVAKDVVTSKQRVVKPSSPLEKRVKTLLVNHGQRIQGLLVGIAASGIVALLSGLV